MKTNYNPKVLIKSSNKSFTNMLTTTSRNHYTLNQMVDRKARIILSMNVIILSFLIGKIIEGELLYNFKFLLFSVASLFCLISIIYGVLAIIPENDKRQLTKDTLKNGEINPLHFGNYLNLDTKTFEDSMIEMSSDADFSHRALLKDIYHIGIVLERKRRYLKNSLVALATGVCTSLLLSFIIRIIISKG